MSEIKIGDRVSYKYESAGDIGRVIEVFPGGEYVSVSFAPDDF